MKARHKRLAFIVVGLIGLAIAAIFLAKAFNSNLVFFVSPTQVIAGEAPQDRTFRLGGLVEDGSVKREDDGLTVHFNVTDGAESVPVIFTGILPDLFREGQGVVAQGRMGTGIVFMAEEVLAKHDENYMPPEVAEALEDAKKAKAATNAPAVSQ
jgi:cytochrome c-type biogenesis protein CcmE